MRLLGEVLGKRARIAQIQLGRGNKRGGAEDGNGGGKKGETTG
jgi:hypothetical protein